MTGDEGGFDQLGHGITCNALIGPEMNNGRFSEPFHFDKIAQFDDEFTDFLRIADGFRVAVFEIDIQTQTPILLLLELLDDIFILDFLYQHFVSHVKHLATPTFLVFANVWFI